MTIKKTLCSLVATATIGLSGCGKEAPKTIQEETLRGTPINVEASVGYRSAAELFVMVEREDGKYILCNNVTPFSWASHVLEGKTIIQSEIDDNDNETILLRGNYNGDRFYFTSVSANGYTVDARR